MPPAYLHRTRGLILSSNTTPTTASRLPPGRPATPARGRSPRGLCTPPRRRPDGGLRVVRRGAGEPGGLGEQDRSGKREPPDGGGAVHGSGSSSAVASSACNSSGFANDCVATGGVAISPADGSGSAAAAHSSAAASGKNFGRSATASRAAARTTESESAHATVTVQVPAGRERRPATTWWTARRSVTTAAARRTSGAGRSGRGDQFRAGLLAEAVQRRHDDRPDLPGRGPA